MKLNAANNGFSLTELVVSITLFMLVSGSIWGALAAANRGKSVTSETVQIAKNVRLGLNLIGRDTYNAGYAYPLRNSVLLPDNRLATILGVPADADTNRDIVPPIIAGDERNTNTFNPTAGERTDQVTFLFKDSTFNLVGSGTDQVSQPLNIQAATTNGSGIDEIVPVSGSPLAAGGRVNDIYLVTGNGGSTLGVATAVSSTTLQFANADVLGFNQTGAGNLLRSIIIPATITRVRMVTYFVTVDGVLMRREFANAPAAALTSGRVDEPLVYGVESFEIRYVMDNGTVLDAPATTALGAVRQVRFTISVRSIERNPAGQFYRETMTATFSTRNLGYDAN